MAYHKIKNLTTYPLWNINFSINGTPIFNNGQRLKISEGVIRFYIEVTDKDGALTSVTTRTITLRSPSGTNVINGANFTNEATGKLAYHWQINDTDEKGIYTCKISLADATNTVLFINRPVELVSNTVSMDL